MYSLKRRRSALLGMPSLSLVVGLGVVLLSVSNPVEPTYADVAPQSTAPPSSRAAASSPAIAYDEIARIIGADGTPPPPGSFAGDAAVIAAQPPPTPPAAPNVHRGGAMTALGLIPVVGGLIVAASVKAKSAAQAAEASKQRDEDAKRIAARRRTGVLASFAFYHGWSRITNSPRYTIIDKPDQGLIIRLDNIEKTYLSLHTPLNVETYAAEPGSQTAAEPTIVNSPAVSSLPSTLIAGLAARGYRTTGAINVSQGTSFCSPGVHLITEIEYVSDLPDPTYKASQDTRALVSACGLGSSVSHREAGSLVLYRVITVDEGTPAAFTIALERGNIRTLGQDNNDLFVPPADFKETK